MFKSGWVSVIGNPNTGKSTLVNALTGEKMSIVTPKPQTTRHRIIRIDNGEGYQIVYSDTPGVLKPHYKMQQAMMKNVSKALDDAEVILFVVDVTEKHLNPELWQRIEKTNTPVIGVLNKIDKVEQQYARGRLKIFQELMVPPLGGQGAKRELLAVSALHGFHVKELKEMLLAHLPEGQPYYPVDQTADMPERFFISEILREKILLFYHEEIPYSVEVVTEEFRDEEKITFIRCVIFVNRHTQKGIIIGNKGLALKKTATAARLDMEHWLGKKVFLEVEVKVKKDWRDNELQLKNFGYDV